MFYYIDAQLTDKRWLIPLTQSMKCDTLSIYFEYLGIIIWQKHLSACTILLQLVGLIIEFRSQPNF